MSAADPIHAHGPSDVLSLLFAHVLKRIREFVSDLVPHPPRDANSTRLRKSLQPGRDINGIAEKIITLHDYVADMHADAKPHLLTLRSPCILLGYGVLHRDRALHGVHGTREIGQNAVTSRGEDSTAI